MLQTIKNKRNEEGGFTLIELLIVVVILGILAAIVVFAIGNTRGDAVKSSCKTNVNAVQLSAEAVKTKTGTYPAAATAAAPGDLLVSANKGGLLKTFPSSSDYQLRWNGTDTVNVYSGSADLTSAAVIAAPLASCDALS